MIDITLPSGLLMEVRVAASNTQADRRTDRHTLDLARAREKKREKEAKTTATNAESEKRLDSQ